MPKLVSEEERRLTREAIYEKTLGLIKEKGLRGVTVDDIVQAAGIGKGSFYGYYPSKEMCFFETLVRASNDIFARMTEVMTAIHTERERAVLLMREIFLADDSIMFAVNEADLEALLRKLPAECRKTLWEMSGSNFQSAMTLMGLDERKMEVVALLTECLGYGVANKNYSREGTKQALNLLIDAIAEFVTAETGGEWAGPL